MLRSALANNLAPSLLIIVSSGNEFIKSSSSASSSFVPIPTISPDIVGLPSTELVSNQSM